MADGFIWRRRATASERASDNARATVVDVVGAGTPNEASSGTGIGAGRSIDSFEGREVNNGHSDGVKCDVSAISGRSVGT